MGAGKTVVLSEASDILAQRKIVHAAIDLDALSLSHLPFGIASDGIMYENLRAVCENYARAGVHRVLLARAVESDVELKLCRQAVGADEVFTCRLVASIETMKERVIKRDFGTLQQQYVARVATLNDTLDRVHLENYSLINQGRRVTDVAAEMLVRAGWISS